MSQLMSSASTTTLSVAQQVQRQLHNRASRIRQRSLWRQRGILALAVVITVLATLPCLLPNPLSLWLQQGCRIGLVLAGLGFSVLVTQSGGMDDEPGQTLAAAAAAADQAIYLYRTLWQETPDRDRWLNQQITLVQQQVQGDWASDGFSAGELVDERDGEDLLADGYLHQRLIPQLEQSAQQVVALTQQGNRYQFGVWICAAFVVLLPVVHSDWMGWSAIASAVALALLLEIRIKSLHHDLELHRQMALGLTLLRDYWRSLAMGDRTVQTFFRLVIATETLLANPYRPSNRQVQEAVNLLRNDTVNELQALLSLTVPVALEQKFRTTVLTHVVGSDHEIPDSATGSSDAASNGKVVQELLQVPKVVPPSPSPVPSPKRGCPHAFVVMPFGRKQGPDGGWIDFNSIYRDLIKPALEEAGFEPFRADEEASSGDILSDMFQELLLADLVVADLSIDNANVFYELGIRHAFRKRGVVHIQAGRAYMPFDIFNVRTLPYHCDDSGCPDPQFLEKDKHGLIKMIQVTWNTERNRVHSPIFNLLTGLIEPDRKMLRTPMAIGYWQEYNDLQSRIAIAQRQKRIGDVVLLAEEVSNPLIKEDILADAGKALKSMGNSALALKQYRQGLKINPENISFRCEEAYHLSRIGQSDEAIVKLEGLLQDVPNCVDATTYLARIYKDLWKQNWITIADTTERIRVAYEASFLLQKSIENYLRSYRIDQNQYYPGINALTLTALLDHLAEATGIDSGDDDEMSYRQQLTALKGSVQFCLESTLRKSPNDYWASLSLGDLAVCVAESPLHVATAYRKALAAIWNNKFALQATFDQLKLMDSLSFRSDYVNAGISVLQGELERFEQQEHLFAGSEEEDDKTKPAQVFLFTGHMIDRPDREKPRFPAAMESEVIDCLNRTLEKLEAHANCIAITPGLACGGDILFVEACLRYNMKVEVYLPFEPSEFIQGSVSFAGDIWVERFYKILNHPNITLHLQPERLGTVPVGDNPYGRNNRWTLYSTLMHDIYRVRLIALWNGQGGDGPGGTADMVRQVRQLGGIVEHIDITKLDYWHHSSTKLDQIYRKLEKLSPG
jgi:tetratricopeptide (TPR) repeat protein